ncbi:ATP-dependent protease LA-related protein [Vibrio nigripulchritudo ATCC 27043]|uniref:AAA family ATPase n=1 Tax=Vibrio nigripulchritudo TaxID=28173 RepID=UPI00021C2376|nr:Lon protease family protein [Vibrio nigripulchritudo]EGU50601.1 ATP-dependent protease LA-related protein [Vibrio nigripulchritudo ATCC 27043]
MQQTWQKVTPQYDAYHALFERFETIPSQSFIAMQPRVSSALIRFDKLSNLTRVLLVNAPDNAIYRQTLVASFQELQRIGEIENKPVVKTESLDSKVLFGRFESKDGEVTRVEEGLLQQANGGYLIVSASLLFASFSNWAKLKSALLGESYSLEPTSSKALVDEIPTHNVDVKLIIVGNRSQMSDLDYMDADIASGFCMFAEIEADSRISDESMERYLGYVRSLTTEFSLPSLSVSGIEELLRAGARECEDQQFFPLGPLWHNTLLSEAAIESGGKTIEAAHIKASLAKKRYSESYLPNRALEDILDGQVVIETKGEQIGQVNGLTVVDVAGHPISYGEPARISCVIHFGDGDISDVERKADLAGNLHAKGMMIMQAFVSRALELEEPLPYSASIVFEQSYCETDGDSASLAQLCSFLSALAEQPVNQQVAVTGAVDQFGRVQAVGGLNEKIEGFYDVCAHQGLTGGQGVILPLSNLKHLALKDELVEAIKEKKFHIWTVESVDQALPLLTGKEFRGEGEDTILAKIEERLAGSDKPEHGNRLIDRIKQWFDHN